MLLYNCLHKRLCKRLCKRFPHFPLSKIMVTLKDVAQKAGVSTATISRYINKIGYISPEKQQRIKKVIEELDYKPNLMARSLRVKKRSKTIGFICPDIRDKFFGVISCKAEEVAQKNGYNIILCNTKNNPEKEKMYIEVLKEKYIDGYILIPSKIEENEKYEILNDEKVVFVDRSSGLPDEISILLDNEWSVNLGMEYLIGLGHKRIGAINLPLNMTTGLERFEGYRNSLINYNIPIDEQLIKFSVSDLFPENIYKDTLELLTMKNRPTAIFPMNGPTTIVVLKAIKKLNLKIPDDISIIGFDEHSYAELLDPPLTTIAQPVSEFGTLGMKTLLKILKGKSIKDKQVKLKSQLIVRESCKELVHSN